MVGGRGGPWRQTSLSIMLVGLRAGDQPLEGSWPWCDLPVHAGSLQNAN